MYGVRRRGYARPLRFEDLLDPFARHALVRDQPFVARPAVKVGLARAAVLSALLFSLREWDGETRKRGGGRGANKHEGETV